MASTANIEEAPSVDISFIIPAFNEAKYLPATLQGIRDAAEVLSGHDLTWEIVVCDNNSTDATSQVAQSHGARVVFEPINQISRSRNTGASIARGAWFVFIDADSIPSSPLLSDLARTIQSGTVAGGGATIRMDKELHWFLMLWMHMWNWISANLSYAAGSFVFTRADAFQAVKGFPDDCYTGEEIWFSRRLKRWARRHGQSFRILTRHPLTTSSRKASLYSTSELFKTLFLSLFLYPFTRGRRSAWFLWYDGRR